MELKIVVDETEAITTLTIKDKIYYQCNILGNGKKTKDKPILEQMLEERIYEFDIIDSIYSALDNSFICNLIICCKNLKEQ